MTSAEGTLTWTPAVDRPELLAPSVAAALGAVPSARVAPIDPDLADTAAFCEAYGSPPEHSANCVVVAGRRGGATTMAAVLVLATHKADVNGVVRRHLGVRKISFAPMDQAVELSGMAYGGIGPVGLPPGWPLLVDEGVAAAGDVVCGSGLRGSKLLVPGAELAALAAAEVLPLAQPS